MTTKQDSKEIRKLPVRKGVMVGKPGKIVTTAMRSKVAFPTSGGTIVGSGGNFYSPEMSTDFLELPQSHDERRNFYRFFYDNDPQVGQAIDLHVELPLSKIRLAMPESYKNREMAKRALIFCEKWAKRIRLLHRLISIVHEYHLIGEVYVIAEDTSPDVPRDVREEPLREITPEGQAVEKWVPRPDADDREIAWLKRNYKGWTAVRVLPPENIHMVSFPFTDEKIIELIPDSKTKDAVNKAQGGDLQMKRVVASYPSDIVQAIEEGRNVPLNTDPDAGTFVHYLARKRSDYEDHGKSILQRCLRTLVFRDKVRQSLTSIASRHMTPYRLITAEDMNDDQTEALREQVDLALQDPDYSIIANYAVTWEEMGADQRLPDWSWVWDVTDRQLYAGLGVTESLLSGEGAYGGERLHLEVINTRYMLLREILQDYVEQNLFRPMCARMGFLDDEDEDGEREVLVPRLSFTRLALRDNADTFDALFNLYQKGSLDIDVILDLLNIDPVTTREKLRRDVFTLNDATFNEVLRGIYQKVGELIVDGSDVTEKIAEGLGLTFTPPKEGGDRFG